MPFTVSHIAAVLPAHRLLARARLFSAAVIGSMVPDFGMLSPESLHRWQTHSLTALFTFCLPVGLVAYALTVLLIKPAMLEVLPDGASARLRSSPSMPIGLPLHSPRAWLIVAMVILLGAATHIIWDGFTHENARAVRMFPVLEAYGPEVEGHSLHLYRWLQYASSVLGLVAVAAAIGLWLRHARPPVVPLPGRLSARERWMWLAVYVLLPLIAVVASLAHALSLPAQQFGSILGTVAIAGMRASIISLVGISLLLLLRRSGRQAAAP